MFVYRVNAQSKAERISVKPGVADGDWVGIEGELKANDQVIVRGAELLRGDEPVQIVGQFEDASQVALK